MLVKEKLQKLISEIEDEQILNELLSLISNLHVNKQGNLYDSLSTEQQEELMLSYKESLDENNLISHKEMQAKHKKWL